MDDREVPEIPVNITNELERQIAEVFTAFDWNQNKTIESKELETVVRAIGCFPNAEEVQELLEECVDNIMPDLIHLARFLPIMCRKLTQHMYQPGTPDQLLEAFRVIDIEGKGYITKDYMVELMTTYGETLSEDELDEMLEVAVDPLTQTVPYEFYLNKLMYVPKINLYDLADVIEASRPRPAEKKRRIVSVVEDFD